ncbi:MAG: hypothetical protein ACI9ZD_001372, partial [Paracoccaceae bacterium]
MPEKKTRLGRLPMPDGAAPILDVSDLRTVFTTR